MLTCPEPPIGGDRRARGRDDGALQIDFLIERAPGEMLDLLADIAADQIADRPTDRADAAARAAHDRAERFERAVERRGYHQRLGRAKPIIVGIDRFRSTQLILRCTCQ
jgi:hypothetical protein